MKTLWALFIIGQIFSAGNMNWQQENGYYEVNPIYGRHPSAERIYITKAVEVAGVYAATRVFPKHKKWILSAANTVCWGFIINDSRKGIAVRVRF